MAARSDQLTSADCRGLADLHIRCLPDSLVSKLGRRYAEAFYRYIARSRQEFAFVHREAGQILSACILSLSPKTLDRRLVTGTSLLFFAALRMLRLPMGKPVTKPMPQKRLSAGGAPGDGGTALDSAPEVILLYTAAESRNRSLGSAVLERCESFLFAQGLRHYTVKAPSSTLVSRHRLQFK